MVSSSVNRTIFLIAIVALWADATSYQLFEPRLPSVQGPSNALAPNIVKGATTRFSPLIRQGSDNQSKLSVSYIFPTAPAASIPSTNTLLQELASWRDLALFSILLNETNVLPNDFGSEPYVVLAPTLFAFQAFFRRIGISDNIVFAATPAEFLDRLDSTFLQSGLLQDVLRYHIIPGNFTEQQLADLGIVTTLQGTDLETRDFPVFGDKDASLPPEVKKRRIYQSIETRQGRLMVMNGVLHPFNISEQLEGSAFEFGSASPFFDDVDLFFVRSSICSFRSFIEARTDLQILNALFLIFERELSFPRVGHLFAPTDTAFISLALQFFGDSVDIDEDDLVPGILSAAEGVGALGKISGVPSLPEILLYHVVETSARYEELIGEESLTPLFPNATLSVTNEGVVDNDPSRGPARRIATFPTLQGCVSIIDSVLLPFDAGIARAVVSASVNVNQTAAENCPEETRECFSGDATVRHSNGRRVRMRDLQAGDEVHIDAGGTSSKIFLFTHRSQGMTRFMELETESGRSIRLTKGHYLYANGRMVSAGSVKVGDVLETESGDEAVVRVGVVVRRGKFAPHSVHGDLMVDGVRVSSYTKAVSPRLAHSALAPVRAAATWGNLKEPLGSLLYDGVGDGWLRPVSWLFGGRDRY